MKKDIQRILLLGSGGLRIGQAGEFDYSGSQAIKAFQEEGKHVILVNPNIATVQTDAGAADTLYLQPLNEQTVTQIIRQERPDAIALSFGGQTALNLGLTLEKSGVLKQFDVQVLGTPTRSIELTEDRELFKLALAEINVDTARSISATTVEHAVAAAEEIQYPVMLRAGFALGGLGSGICRTEQELRNRASEALHGAPQILIEEYLGGWKEVEYEIVRDAADNCIAVCNMENMDPMGIHTGESIVVAPSQTLNNQEYHMLREVSIKVARHVGIVGECNIQFALSPTSNQYRVIEMNARLSRSSALASKATGYPLAFVAAKLALGKHLNEIPNAVTQTTSTFFEPALDYLVLKMPRWDVNKFKQAERRIGSEMKSVGEVMAIGRSFSEVLQKAVRMLGLNMTGLHDYPYEIESQIDEIKNPTFRRLFALYNECYAGTSVETLHELSQIDRWFLHHIHRIAQMQRTLESSQLTPELLESAKRLGFSDDAVGMHTSQTGEEVRALRKSHGILPVIKQIDTMAGEFPAQTNYLYLTYHGTSHDVHPSIQRPIIIIGSGPYAIGSSVEFDWCAVNAARTCRVAGKSTIMINSNPETVSTDYDESDRLYFDEPTFERIVDIAEFESPQGVIVSVGGQTANNVALPLHRAGFPILGTSPEDIDRAENRETFSSLLQRLGIDQPAWERVSTIDAARRFAERIGYPILVRPSYVLSGAAMNVVFSDKQLIRYLEDASIVSPDHPVVISQFMLGAKELEVDGVAMNGEIVLEAISEHVEQAGVHSGDATIVLPPQRLYLETIRRAKKLARKVIAALNISGPFNIQFLARDNWLKVIECNVRSSRSFPFVSKVTNINFIEAATQVMLGTYTPQQYQTLELDYVGVKTPQFSYSRIKGADPVAHVEMASTGEVAVIADTYEEAFFQSWHATEQSVKDKTILLSIDDSQKQKLLDPIKFLSKQGWKIYATEGTHDLLTKNGISSICQYKMSDGLTPNVADVIKNQEIGIIINIPSPQAGYLYRTDGFKIRRLAIDHHVPLITNEKIAALFLKCLATLYETNIPVKSWQSYTHNKSSYDGI